MLAYAPISLRPTIRFRPFVYLFSRAGFTILGMILLFALAFFWTAGARVVMLPALVLAFLFLLLLSTHLRRMRQLRAQLVLQYLASAIELRLPLPAYLRSAARSESLGVRSRLHRCANYIEDGASIGTAFHLATGEIDLRVAGMLDAAQSTGHLDATIQHLLRPTQSQTDAPEASSGMSLAYVTVVSLLLMLVSGSLLVFVFPKYAMLMNDFGLRAPWAMSLLASLLDNYVNVMLILLIVLAVLTLTIAGSATRQLFTSRIGPGWTTGISDRLTWYLPPLRQLTRDRAYADATWLLAGAVESGQTLDEATNACIRAGTNRVFTRQLIHFHSLLLGGADAASAGRDAGLPSLWVSLLQHQSAPDLAQAMRFASMTYAGRQDRLIIALRAILPVVMSGIFAAGVLVVALALFTPLIGMIDLLSTRIFAP